MANLGKLWFELGLKDKTDKDIAEIRKNVEKRLKALGVDVKITPDLSELKNLKEVNVEIVTDTDKMIKDIQTALKAADISIDPSVSLNKAMQSITGQRALTIDTGALGRIEALAKKQSAAINQATGALLNQQKVYKEYSNTTMTAIGSIKMMESELNKLRDTYRSLSEVDRNSSIGKGLLQQINNADEALAKVNAQMANNSTLAKAMGTRYNGLQVQLAQVARELPNFALSFSTGVISLSNNLPMLADEISRVRQEVALLRQSGQTATPVWKQVLSGLLSWQTALIVGITVLVAYSREIGEWINALIKGGDAAVYLAESQKKFNDLQKDASESVSKEISKLELLYNTTQNAALSIDARREAVEKLQQMYPDYLGKLSEEAILAGKASEAYSLLAESIKNAASLRLIEEQRAKASESLAKAKEKEMNVQSKLNALMKELGAVSEQDLQNKAYDFSRNYGNYIRNLINDRNSAQKEQQSILDDAEKWSDKYSSIFNKSVNKGQLDILFRDMSEYQTYLDTIQDLNRSLSLSEITQEEYNSKVNEAKGILLAAADAAKIGGSEVERLRAEYIAFNKVQNAKKSSVNTSKIQDDAIKANQQLQQATVKAEMNLEQARINLMAEGGEKELAQLKLNHKKRLSEIDKQTAEYINKAREAEKAEWMSENPGKKESEFKSSITGINDLPSEFQDIIQQLIETENKLYTKSVTDYFNSVAKEFQGYLEKRKSIEQEYAKKRNVLFKSGASADTIKETYYQEDEALKRLDVEIAQRENTFQSWVNKLSSIGLEQLRKMLIEAQAELMKAEISDPDNGEKLASYRAMLVKIREELDKIERGEREAQGKDDNKGKIKDWKELYKVLDKVNDSFIEIGDSVGGTAGKIIKEAGQITSSLLQMANGIKSIEAGMSALEKSSIILTAISAGLKVVTGIFGLFNRTDYMAEYRKEVAKLNDELKKVKENARIDSGEYDTIFGTDEWANARNNIDAARDALMRYQSTLNDIKNRKVYEDVSDKVANIFDIDLDKTFDSLEESLANMQVQIRHSTWFRSAKYASLKDAAPELFNEDSSVNMDALAEFVNSDMFKKLSEENQRYLQQMLDNWSTYEEALDSVKNYLTGIFGDLGNTMMDALVDAFENGTDAAKKFTDSVSDMLEKLATNMIYSLTLGDVFEKAQNKAEEIMNKDYSREEDKFKDMTELMGWITDNAIKAQGDVNKYLEAWKQIAKDKGYDIFTPDNEKQNGLSSSIQGVTEDTANLLGSYLNAIRHDVSVKRSLLEDIAGNLLPTMSITAQAQLQQLNAIADNTKINADAALEIQKSAIAIQTSLSSVITQGKSGKAIRIQ